MECKKDLIICFFAILFLSACKNESGTKKVWDKTLYQKNMACINDAKERINLIKSEFLTRFMDSVDDDEKLIRLEIKLSVIIHKSCYALVSCYEDEKYEEFLKCINNRPSSPPNGFKELINKNKMDVNKSNFLQEFEAYERQQ
jgi:hypothetical protein